MRDKAEIVQNQLFARGNIAVLTALKALTLLLG